MPYGDLAKQAVQRFATYEDMIKHDCTIEEMEEYEPHIKEGILVYAGVDYGEILKRAEEEADVILWDGGNNDIPFYLPDTAIVIVDPHRPGHELLYRLADVIVINKIDTAKKENVDIILTNIKKYNPNAKIIKANSVIKVKEPQER